jgi:hypothetical protein
MENDFSFHKVHIRFIIIIVLVLIILCQNNAEEEFVFCDDVVDEKEAWESPIGYTSGLWGGRWRTSRTSFVAAIV